MAGAYRPIAVFVLIVIVFSIGLALLLPREEIGPRIRLGENMIYGIYIGGTRKGSWKMWIEKNMTENAPVMIGEAIVFENTRCYKANYTMERGRVRQGGWMVFDENGRLRHAKVWYCLDDIPRWATEIAYFHADNLMYVIRDNYEDYSRKDNLVPMRKETVITEYLWYLLRLESLKTGYAREFDLNAFPDATQTVPAKVTVVGEERAETFAGTFDSWLVSGQGPFDWILVEKKGKLVAKLQEQSGGESRVFVLESYT